MIAIISLKHTMLPTLGYVDFYSGGDWVTLQDLLVCQ